MTDAWQVVTTANDEDVAQRIATELVDRRLAACAQVSGPVASTFHWKGRIETAQEWVCTAKTTADRFLAIELLVKELHPYEVPELIATPIVAASAEYLNWIVDEMKR